MPEAISFEPAAAGPWWVMAEDPEGTVWVMLGPVNLFQEAGVACDYLDAVSDPGWCYWVWSIDQFRANGFLKPALGLVG